MSPSQWARVKVLFDQASALEPEDQLKFLEQCRNEDPEVLRELTLLLEQQEHAGSFLEKPAARISSQHTFADGQIVLNRFRILRFVKRGGMGEVYEAFDQELNERVAVKTIRPAIAQDPQMLARFKREIQLARRVTHSNVCRTHELFPQPGFLTMEFLSGESLAEKLERAGPLRPAEVEEITLQLCSGLQAAHNEGIVHRDFKSGNIMLVPPAQGPARVVITDFGLAREVRPAQGAGGFTARGAVLGTPPYMAPEQLEAKVVGPHSDLYSLGVVIYEMLTGEPPFPSETPAAAAVQRLKHPTPPTTRVPGLDAKWDRIISRLLAYEPERRPASAAEVARLLRTPESAMLPSTVAMRASRRKFLWIGPGLAALLLAGGLLWTRSRSVYRPPSSAAQHWYDKGTAALREGTFLTASKALAQATQADERFVLAHARLADAWTELDYSDKAKDEMIRASNLEALRGLPAIDREYVEAVRQTIAGNPVGAVQSYRHILEALPEKEKPYGYVDLGRALEKAAQTEPAIQAYQTAAARAPEYPASFLRLSNLLGRQAKNAEAEAALAKADSLYRAATNVEGIAEVDYQRGLLASQQGRLDVARTYTMNALTAARSVQSIQLEVRALLQLSGIDHRGGDLANAEAEASRAIQLAQENGIISASVPGLVALGNKYLFAGDFSKAEAYFQKALDLAGKGSNRRMQAAAQLSLASVSSKRGKPDETIALAKAALDYYQPNGFVTNANSAVTLMIRAQKQKGDLEGALKAYQARADFGRKVNDPDIAAHAEEGIGGTLLEQEKFPECVAHYRMSIEEGKELGISFLSFAAIHLADALGSLGRYADAEEQLRQAARGAKVQPELNAEIARASADLALSKSDAALANRICKASLQSKDPRTAETERDLNLLLARGLSRSGNSQTAIATAKRVLEQAKDDRAQALKASFLLAELLMNSGSFLEAQETLDKLFADFDRSGQRHSQWRALLLLARLQRRRGDTGQASKTARKALDILQTYTHNWTVEDAQTYLKRPDVTALRNELAGLCRSRTRRVEE